MFTGPKEDLFSLEDVAKVEAAESPKELRRWNGRPSLWVERSDGEALLQRISNEVSRKGELEIELVTEGARAEKAVNRVYARVPLVVLVIFVILAWQVGSVSSAIAVALNGLPALFGAVLALSWTSQGLV